MTDPFTGHSTILDKALEAIESREYWSAYPAERAAALGICNSGIYAVTREALPGLVTARVSLELPRREDR